MDAMIIAAKQSNFGSSDRLNAQEFGKLFPTFHQSHIIIVDSSCQTTDMEPAHLIHPQYLLSSRL